MSNADAANLTAPKPAASSEAMATARLVYDRWCAYPVTPLFDRLAAYEPEVAAAVLILIVEDDR